MFQVSNRMEKFREGGSKGTKTGAFVIPPRQWHFTIEHAIYIISSTNAGWEHVSISCKTKAGKSIIPDWETMCVVKDQFWSAEDCVVQYHPPKSDYVNVCKWCLHLWRPIYQEIPRPPKALVY
jgi:hypothetical protein